MREEFIFGLGLLVMVSVHAVWLVKRKNGCLLSDVCSWFTGLGFGFGPIMAWLAGPAMLQTGKVVGVVYMAVGLYCLGLIVSGWITRVSFRAPMRTARCRLNKLAPVVITAMRALPAGWVVISFAVIISLRAYAFSVGGGISGLNSEESMVSWSYPMVVLEKVSSPLRLLVSGVALVWLFEGRKKSVAGLILITIGLFSVLEGRRAMLWLSTSMLFVTFVYFNQVKIRYLVYGVSTVFFVFYIVSPFYLVVRDHLQKDVLPSGGEDVVGALARAISEGVSADRGKREERSRKNLQKRPLGARTFMLSVFDAQFRAKPLMGDAFIQSQMTVLPRFLRWDESLSLNPKHYVQWRLNLPLRDANHTPAAAGVADFGLFGALVAGLVMGLFLNLVLAFGVSQIGALPFFGLYVTSTLWEIAINFEVTPGFESIVIRNTLIVLFVLVVLKGVGFRMRRRARSVARPRVVKDARVLRRSKNGGRRISLG